VSSGVGEIADDETQVSLAGMLISQASTGSDVRFEKVAALRRRIEAGTYDVARRRRCGEADGPDAEEVEASARWVGARRVGKRPQQQRKTKTRGVDGGNKLWVRECAMAEAERITGAAAGDPDGHRGELHRDRRAGGLGYDCGGRLRGCGRVDMGRRG